jgi:hypothetical protein
MSHHYDIRCQSAHKSLPPLLCLSKPNTAPTIRLKLLCAFRLVCNQPAVLLLLRVRLAAPGTHVYVAALES